MSLRISLVTARRRPSRRPHATRAALAFLALGAGAALLACDADRTVRVTTGPAATSAGSGGSAGAGGAGGATASSSESSVDIAVGVSTGTATTGGGSDLPVDVVITADNAYSFGYGDASAIVHFVQGSRAQSAGEIFNCGPGPEAYTVPAADAPPTAYLYVVTWDDLAVTQGVLGQFRRGANPALYTGDPSFEVCATGLDFSNSTTGPDLANINAQIALCNAGKGDPATTSAGWVTSKGAVTPGAIGKLAVGEANSSTPGGTFPPTCPSDVAPPGSAAIDNAASWMWFDPIGVANPFQSNGTNLYRSYLIFRVAAEDIPVVN